MGVKLMVEVLDHYHGPRSRKLWLVGFAENANDRTRTGWPGREVLARRVGVSGSRASNIAAELIAEGVIKREGSRRVGDDPRRGRRTVYVLAELGPDLAEGSPRPNSRPGAEGSPEPNSRPGRERSPRPNPRRAAERSPRPNSRRRAEGSESGSEGSPSTTAACCDLARRGCVIRGSRGSSLGRCWM